MLQRSVGPVVHETGQIIPLEYDSFDLKNSLNVVYAPDHHRDMELFNLIIRLEGGVAVQNKPLQAQMAAGMLLEGTAEIDGKEIAEYIDFYAATITPVAEKDYITISVKGLRKDFKAIMSLVSAIIKESVYPEKKFNLLKNRMISRYRTNIRRKSWQAKKEMDTLIFPSHPYGHKTDMQAFSNIFVQDVQEYYKDHIQKGAARVFVVGIREEVLEAVLEETLGVLSLTSQNGMARKNIDFSNQRRTRHINVDGAVQSAIRLSWKVVNKAHKDFMDLTILNTVLGGYFGSRMMKNLREEKGITYGAGSSIASTKQTGIWTMATEVDANATQLALEEIYKEINRLKTNLIREEEMNLVKNYIPGKVMRSLEKDEDKLRAVIQLSGYGFPGDYYQRYLEKIKQADAKRLRELANEYMLFDQISEVVVGKI